MMFRSRGDRRKPPFRVGDWVEIRSHAEIEATLDAEGKLEGLPFMAEMARYCGRRFRVYRRADKVFMDHHHYVARSHGTVLLEGVRCDGAAHGGCQMGCLWFWKEAWLKAATPTESEGEADQHDGTPETTRHELDADAPTAPPSAQPAPCPSGDALPMARCDRLSCQATELVRATAPLPWWDVRQYARDVLSGNMRAWQLVRMLTLLTNNAIRRLLGFRRRRAPYGRARKTPIGRLDLRAGELVEVKSQEEIEATLDENGCTRGLGFAPDMLDFCGRRFRVARRVERIVLEWSGRLQPISDTVILEGVTCNGVSRRGCPRDCYQLWREAWLKRVP
jgi:hypothetical protein